MIIPFLLIKRIVDVGIVVVVVVVDERITANQIIFGDEVGPECVKRRISFEFSVEITTDEYFMKRMIGKNFFQH